MKIVSGQLKGRNFYMPAQIRPTQNLVRKAIFDVLGDVSGLEFLELFAGSGGVSFEAISLGAKSAAVVEREERCMEVIRENLKLLKIASGDTYFSKNRTNMGSALEEFRSSLPKMLAMAAPEEQKSPASPLGSIELLTGDVFPVIKYLALKQRKFDMIFVDPPFGCDLGKKTLKALGAHDILRPHCFIIIQGEKKEILPSSEGRFLLVRKKNYGASQLSFYEGKAS